MKQYLIYMLRYVLMRILVMNVDSDGEFLLIEAANALPPWATPENCQDNVFIHNGTIHIVREKEGSFSSKLCDIYENTQRTRLSDKVQAILLKRIMTYPEELKKRKHKARAFLPEKAASILRQEPGLVASAIRTIYHSDPFERRVCRAMRYFPPEQRTMFNVKMTKCLYAMATHCRYTGDPRTGWNLPPANSTKYAAHLLGVKIACGLEMLVARANENRRQRKDKLDSISQTSKFNERALNAYLGRLETNGYFKDLLPGSQEHAKLVINAKDYFLNHLCIHNPVVESNKSDAERVLEAWENIQTNDIEMHEQDESALSPADSSSWLNINPDQLETLLNQQWNGDKDRNTEQDHLTLREKVQAFLKQSSDVDGVKFFEDQSEDSKQDVDNGKIEFDADVFDSALRDILDLVVPGGDGEFEGSSEGSLGGDDEDKGGEMDKYMRLLDTQLQSEMVKDQESTETISVDTVEDNLMKSMESEAGSSGPVGNIIGGPARKFLHLHLQSPTMVPPDLQS
ncbi:protein ecdysoneless homolog isoform X2 [Prorops nasuta]|uniref:protein ecdysoneless homolog isoform X2 n=1 Tax=Prorops nasuta TaxID=863751 RepID=UPI0034CEE0E7